MAQMLEWPMAHNFQGPPCPDTLKQKEYFTKSLALQMHSERNKVQAMCMLCKNKLRSPRALPCLHVFCHNCIQYLLDQRTQHPTVTCPKCQVESRVPHIGAAGYIYCHYADRMQEVFDQLQKNPVQCSNSDKPEPKGMPNHENAQHRCLQCMIDLCPACLHAHQEDDLTAGHKVKALVYLYADPQEIRKHEVPCTYHPSQYYTDYCRTCRWPVCRSCAAAHTNHQFTHLRFCADDLRFSLTMRLHNDIPVAETFLKSVADERKTFYTMVWQNFNEANYAIETKIMKAHRELERVNKVLLEAGQRTGVAICEKYNADVYFLRGLRTDLMVLKTMLRTVKSIARNWELPGICCHLFRHTSFCITHACTPLLTKQRVEFGHLGNPYVDLKLSVGLSRKIFSVKKAFANSVDCLAANRDVIVALHWDKKSQASTTTVIGLSCEKTNNWKRLLKRCVHAYRLAFVHFEECQTLAVIERNLNLNDVRTVDPKDYLEVDRAGHFKMTMLNPQRESAYVIKEGTIEAPMSVCANLGGGFIYSEVKMAKEPRIMLYNGMGPVKRIYEDNEPEKNLSIPTHMCTNINGDIVVSDCGQHAVIIFRKDGSIRRKYTDFPDCSRVPNGVACDAQGYIYVANWFHKCVIRLDKNGNFRDVCLNHEDELDTPTSLLVRNDQLLVGTMEGSIHAFTLWDNIK